MIGMRAVIGATSVVLTAIAIGGCSSRLTSIVEDDAALCQFSAQANRTGDVSSCRGRLDAQHRRLASGSATRIDGYALLNTPGPPRAVADQCKAPNAPKDCGGDDVTGTIPAQPKR